MALRGALRINAAMPDVRVDAGNPTPPNDTYLTQLTKLFPVEVVSIYPAGVKVLQAADMTTWWFAWLCVVGIVLFRSITTARTDGSGTQYVAVGVAIISFLLWVVLLGGGLLPGGAPSEKTIPIATVVTLLWTWLAPLIVAQFEPAAK